MNAERQRQDIPKERVWWCYEKEVPYSLYLLNSPQQCRNAAAGWNLTERVIKLWLQEVFTIWLFSLRRQLKSSGRISRWKGLILWREVITFSVFTKCAASVLKGGGRLILPKGWLSYDHKRILWSEYLNDNAREWVRHRSNFTAWMLKGSGRISPRKGSDDVMKKRFHILCIC